MKLFLTSLLVFLVSVAIAQDNCGDKPPPCANHCEPDHSHRRTCQSKGDHCECVVKPEIDAVHLINGPTTSEGRLEIYHNDAWTAICDEGFGIPEAQVTCRMLGLPTTGAHVHCCGFYGHTTNGPSTWLEDLRCLGNESSLLDCPFITSERPHCRIGENIGVVCHK